MSDECAGSVVMVLVEEEKQENESLSACCGWQCLRDCLQLHHCHFITHNIDRSFLSAHGKTNRADKRPGADGGRRAQFPKG